QHSSASLRSEEVRTFNSPSSTSGTPRVHAQPERAFTLARNDCSDSPEYAVAHQESAALARKLIEQSCRRQGITPGQLTLHADHGPSMTSKSVALLLSDLAVTKTHSRPYVSNDNPFSEAQFKTMKYRPEFPERFGSIQDSRSFGHVFFPWYNTEHHHSGLGLLTPHEVHYGLAEKRVEARARVLAAAYAAHPERFVTGLPRPPALPTEVWINRPKAVLAEPRCVSEPEA